MINLAAVAEALKKWQKICKDCGGTFIDEHDLTKYCELCRDRRQEWKEDGIQDEMGYGDDE